MPYGDDLIEMLAIIFPVVKQYFTDSSSHENTDDSSENDVVNSFGQNDLSIIKFLIHPCFSYPIEKKISDNKREEIENAVPVNRECSDSKCYHEKRLLDKFFCVTIEFFEKLLQALQRTIISILFCLLHSIDITHIVLVNVMDDTLCRFRERDIRSCIARAAESSLRIYLLLITCEDRQHLLQIMCS